MKKSCKKKGDTTKTKKPTMKKVVKPKKKPVSRGDGGGRHSPFFR